MNLQALNCHMLLRGMKAIHSAVLWYEWKGTEKGKDGGRRDKEEKGEDLGMK